jgi:hypothetical protein
MCWNALFFSKANNIPLYAHSAIFGPFTINGPLRCFYFLTAGTNAAMHVGVHIPVQRPACSSLGYIQKWHY